MLKSDYKNNNNNNNHLKYRDEAGEDVPDWQLFPERQIHRGGTLLESASKTQGEPQQSTLLSLRSAG